MPLREDRAPVWAIWLLIAFGAVQPIVWWLVGGPPRYPVALAPLLVVWVALLALAALATRRIASLWTPAVAAGAGPPRNADRSRSAADPERDARHHRAVGRRPARLSGARLTGRPTGAVRSCRAGAPVRGRTGVPDLHRAGAAGGAPGTATARDRLQSRAHDPRRRRSIARADDHRRHQDRRARLPRRQHPS